MKVILINPPSPWLISDRDMPAQGILSIAAYLRENKVDVTLVDLAGLPEKYWYIPDGDIYGIGFVTPQYPYAKKIIQKIRERNPKQLIVLGGVHPTILPERTLKETNCDIIVRGDGEKTMLEIVKGRRDKIITAPLIENIDELPMPAWDMIDAYDYFKIGTNSFYGDTKNNMEGYVQTGRGCPFNCAFCAQKYMTKCRIRYKSTENVIKEINYLKDNFGCDRFYFFDDNFIIDKKRVEKLCEQVSKIKGIDWHCLSRVDMADYDLYVKMRKAGCKGVCYGIESNSQKILDNANKRTTAEQNRNAIETAKKAGLKVRNQVIVGLPGETDETVEETAELIRTSQSDTWGVHIFVPLPGSDIWENNEKYNFPIDKNTDFSYYKTIGGKDENDAAKLHKNPEQIIKWKQYLIEVAGDKDIARFAERKRRHK